MTDVQEANQQSPVSWMQSTTWYDPNEGHVSERGASAAASAGAPEEVRAWDDFSDTGSDFDPDTVPEVYHDAWFVYYSDPANSKLYREALATLPEEELTRIEEQIFTLRYKRDERWCRGGWHVIAKGFHRFLGEMGVGLMTGHIK